MEAVIEEREREREREREKDNILINIPVIDVVTPIKQNYDVPYSSFTTSRHTSNPINSYANVSAAFPW